MVRRLASNLGYQVQTWSEIWILKLSEETETGFHERLYSPSIRNRGPNACNQNARIRPQTSQKQVERSRTKATTKELWLADQYVYVHEALRKVCKTSRLQFVRWWCLPTNVADEGSVSLYQRTIFGRPF